MTGRAGLVQATGIAERIHSESHAAKVMSAEDAAALIAPDSTIGMSGFTGAGHAKAVPGALARRIEAAHERGRRFAVNVWTGASTAPELDGLLAAADGIDLRMPYQSDPVSRRKINEGEIEYLDMHLSHVAQTVWEGFFGHLDLALVEVSGITETGQLVPSSSVGNNKTWLDLADRVILEINAWQPSELEGMHDIYYGTALPPRRKPIQLVNPSDRIGDLYLRCDPDKIVAIVLTDAPDRYERFKAADDETSRIAQHLMEFLAHEVRRGRLPRTLLPLQSESFSAPRRSATTPKSCVHVIVTEQGLADLRGLPPRRRAQTIIDHCAHPDYRDALEDYFHRAQAATSGKHTPHLLDEVMSWHSRYLTQQTMRPT